MINLKTFCLLMILSSCAATFAAAQQKPTPKPATTQSTPQAKKFESKAGNFSINIFQAPTQVRNLASEAAQKKRVSVGEQFFWQFDKSIYTVMYSNAYNADGAPLTISLNDMNSGTRNGITNLNAKLLSEKNIAYGRHAGTEFRSLMPNGITYIMRNYLIGTVGYLVTGAYVDAKDEKAVLDVMNSFKLLVEKK